MTKRLLTLEEVAAGALPPLEDDGSDYDYTPDEVAQMKAMVDEARAGIAADPSSLLSLDAFSEEMRGLKKRLIERHNQKTT